MSPSRLLSIFFLALLLTSCGKQLTVQTQYLTRHDLASYYVNTPDPLLDDPDVGQRLIVQWSLNQSIASFNEVYILLKLRFRNHEELTQRIDLKRAGGIYVYTLINEEYFRTRGIQTYKAELVADGCVLEEWRHTLWADLIVLNPCAPLPDTDDDDDDE